MLRQIVEYDILDQVPVSQIGEAAHEKAHGAHDYVRNNRLLEHASRLILLRIDVKDAHVAFKNAEHLTHEHWQHTQVEVLIVKGLGHFLLTGSDDFSSVI